jgi:hypothetical protein
MVKEAMYWRRRHRNSTARQQTAPRLIVHAAGSDVRMHITDAGWCAHLGRVSQLLTLSAEAGEGDPGVRIATL